MPTFKLKAKLVDVVKRIVFPAEIIVQEGRVTYIKPASASECKTYILPGFIDSHVHIGIFASSDPRFASSDPTLFSSVLVFPWLKCQ